MKGMKGALVGIAVLVALAPIAAQRPVRDNQQPVVVTGTSGVTGRVVADDAGAQPLRRVEITLRSRDGAGSMQTTTDDAGRFVFTRLPAGRYTLTATRGGFVTAGYGAIGPGLPPTLIAVADAEIVSLTAIRMQRGAVIAGTLRGPTGRPVEGVSMGLMRLTGVNGERRRSRAVDLDSATTDDRGAYRFYGLPPGDYLVSAFDRSSLDSTVAHASDAEYQWAAAVLAGRAGAAGTRGDAPRFPALETGGRFQLANVFYPGTTDALSATAVSVQAGEERGGIDFQLQQVRTSTVRGVIADEGGQPVAGMTVWMNNVVSNQFAAVFAGFPARATSAADGTFVFVGVAPGDYAMVTNNDTRGWARTRVSVSGADIAGIALTLRPGVTLTGQLVAVPSAGGPAALPRVNIQLVPAVGDRTSFTSSPADVSRDGSFVIHGITPGVYRTRPAMPGGDPNAATWTAKSATLDGRDTIDETFEISGAGDVDGMVIEMTDRLARISGVLIDAAGRPAEQLYILAFAVDQRRWTKGSRWVRNARAGSDGTFAISGLPAGEYYVCALTALDASIATEPTFLEQLVGASFTVTLADGEQKTQNLKIGG
jgi:uncharacterized protein (DUF2141 family)